MPNYQLINPYIEGDFKTAYDGKSPIDAGEKAWVNLSRYLTGNVPKFAFTMERTSDHKHFHFVVKENVEGDNVSFSVKKVDVKVPKEGLQAFKKKVSSLRDQSGGKKKDDSSSSSDSDSELYKKIMKHKYNHMSQPILYWWYTPYLYDVTLGSVYMPNFTIPLSPYVELYPLYGYQYYYGGNRN